MRNARRLPTIAILALAACSGESHSSAKTRPTTLVMTLPADADILFPPLSTNETSRQLCSVVFEKLAEIGDSLNVVGDKGYVPSLASSWTWSPDSMSIAFHIDPKAHWQDGVPVHASDVVYTFHVNTSKDVGSAAGPLLADIDSVTAQDSLTAVFWFHRRSLEQFYSAAMQNYVLPAHLLAKTADSALKTSPFGRNPIGSGPYKFVRWVSGSVLEVAADSTFHRGRPKLDRLIWSVAGNPDAAMLRLYSGEANFTEFLRKQDVVQVAKHPELRAVPYPSMIAYYARFNERARKGRGPNPIFADREVRRALTMAVDRRRAVSTVFDSTTHIVRGPYTHQLSTYDSSIPSIPYAPDSAAAILQRRGWVMGSDGIRHKGAQKLEWSILVPGTSTERQQMCVLLQDMYRKVGAQMNIERIDFPTMGERMASSDFDMSFEGMTADPTPSGIRQDWVTAASRNGGGNPGYYSNPKFDATVDSAIVQPDAKLAVEQYRRAYAIIAEDAPAIWLYEGSTVAGMSANVHPVHMRADLWFAHLADWTIGDGADSTSASVALAANAR
jgi:peptide/nickel transport system substrate-binding protein